MNFENIFNYLNAWIYDDVSYVEYCRLQNLLTSEERKFVYDMNSNEKNYVFNKCKEKGVTFIQVYLMLK